MILIDEAGEPTTALPPGAASQAKPITPLSEVVRRLRTFIVADNRSTFQEVLDLADELGEEPEPEPTIVVVRDAGRIAGVATAADLRNQLFRIRYSSRGVTLPGPITVPKIVRRCNFIDDDEACGYTKRFATRPPQMPPCPNPRTLSDHLFVW
ncbi:hypothetical protein [Mycolicibacter icosiumassiliensis]|uniref:hypothetical protein n=1 Tax=Mycolicibacter icosiumassiliensis TaxID=1792835 RepID=UPI0012B67E87|nr:hypothetical protein [Mycolicibacter icosiumassiliensis]